jgi:hypothetical protein
VRAQKAAAQIGLGDKDRRNRIGALELRRALNRKIRFSKAPEARVPSEILSPAPGFLRRKLEED